MVFAPSRLPLHFICGRSSNRIGVAQGSRLASSARALATFCWAISFRRRHDRKMDVRFDELNLAILQALTACGAKRQRRRQTIPALLADAAWSVRDQTGKTAAFVFP
jgi:hypothetical protein